MSHRRPVGIIGGSGYVSGELLRLIAGHPGLTLGCIASVSRSGSRVTETFPNLAGCYPETTFVAVPDLERSWENGELAGVFCAAPHGAAAKLIDGLLDSGGDSPGPIVDISADFRFRDPETFERIYGQDHGAPGRTNLFTCAVPEHQQTIPTPHAAQPGCFATAMLIGVVPLLQSGLTEPDFFISGVTGSTGSGSTPIPTTHHPERHSNLFAYKPLAHRHAPEVETIAEAATGRKPAIRFVPHSGPFARGIHVTIQGRLADGAGPEALAAALEANYAGHTFIEVVDAPPRIKDVAGSNRARLHVACSDGNYALLVVIDNLIKGAAGGAIQWMNRLLALPEAAGLTQAGPAWI
ncbi:MAG: N-acetyl-gamma-glutamyl-phosphate reductase [Gammaproteobacteria bacterium]|jgi:N-acetyl-gamma-glutamyl-phosphate reductase